MRAIISMSIPVRPAYRRVHQRHRRRRPGAVHIELVQGDDAAAPNLRQQLSQGAHGSRRVHQHEATDERVGRRVEHHFVEFSRLEAHVAQACDRRARRGHGDSIGRTVHADHRTSRADKVRGEERNVPGAASDVEHAHAGRKARAPEEIGGELPEIARLRDEALQLVVRMAEDAGRANTSALDRFVSRTAL
jgi:hypothetical protein